jgi:choline transport protein
MSVLSWQAATAAGGYVTGTLVLALFALNYPNQQDSDWQIRWQGTLLAIGCTIIVAVMNIFCNKILPLLQSILMCLHVAAWIVTISIFGARSPHVSASEVFGSASFENYGGWNSMGLTLMVGQVSAIYALVSFLHMTCIELS